MNFQTDRNESNVIIEPNNIQQQPVTAMQWFQKFQDLRPQTSSLIAGTTVMMYSGLHLGWGIFNLYIGDQKWAKQQDRNTLVLCICSWFSAAILGLIFTAFLIKKTSKMILYVSLNLHNDLIYLNILFTGHCFSFSLVECYFVLICIRDSCGSFCIKTIGWFVTWYCLSDSPHSWM